MSDRPPAPAGPDGEGEGPPTLRQWRQRRVLGTAALAELAGVTKQTIIAIEHGRVRAIKYRTIRKVAAALGVEPDDVAELRRAMTIHEGE